MSDEEYPNVLAFLREAAATEGLRHQAKSLLRDALATGALDFQQRNGPRVSDAGSCVREIWYKDHGGIDLPVDPIDMQLARFDEGTLNGAWVGALIAVGASDNGWQVSLEEAVTCFGLPGHIDVRLWRETRSHVVEIKSKYETTAIKNPEQEFGFQLLQAAAYCHADQVKSQTFSLVVFSPSASKGARAAQFHFQAAPYEPLVKADFARLAAAQRDEMPAGDPQQAWRCYTCGASACEKNKNKQQQATEVLF